MPRAAIHAALAETERQEQRARKLTAEATVWLLIAMNLYTHLALGHVLRKVSQGLRFIWPDPAYRVPGASAFVYRRYQLGAAPLHALFARLVCARGAASGHGADAGRVRVRPAADGP